MRKQLVVARPFPPQCIAQGAGIDLDQEQSGLAGEMLSGRLRKLRGARKMNEAVARSIGAAAVHALPLGLAPGRSGTNFVDLAHLPGVLLVVESLGISRNFRTGTDRIGATCALQGW